MRVTRARGCEALVSQQNLNPRLSLASEWKPAGKDGWIIHEFQKLLAWDIFCIFCSKGPQSKWLSKKQVCEFEPWLQVCTCFRSCCLHRFSSFRSWQSFLDSSTLCSSSERKHNAECHEQFDTGQGEKGLRKKRKPRCSPCMVFATLLLSSSAFSSVCL